MGFFKNYLMFAGAVHLAKTLKEEQQQRQKKAQEVQAFTLKMNWKNLPLPKKENLHFQQIIDIGFLKGDNIKLFEKSVKDIDRYRRWAGIEYVVCIPQPLAVVRIFIIDKMSPPKILPVLQNKYTLKPFIHIPVYGVYDIDTNLVKPINRSAWLPFWEE